MSSFFYNGYNYRRNKKTLNKTYYMCSDVDRTKCLARLIASEDKFVVRGNHTCEKNSTVERVGSIPDITPEEYD
ncbi:hypothetical protein HZS_4609, partial [Henneguya salminicola]